MNVQANRYGVHDALALASRPEGDAPAAQGVEKGTFRNAMSLLGAAVSIVATDGPAGRAGFTATAVCSVTDEPPTLLVCVKRTSSAFEAFAGNSGFTINVLSAGQEALSDLFGGRTAMADRFGTGEWLCGANGTPQLRGALVSIDCALAQAVDVGTHRVLFGRVMEVREGGAASALVHFDRRYRHVPRKDRG